MLRLLSNPRFLRSSRIILFQDCQHAPPTLSTLRRRFASNVKGAPLLNNDIPYTQVRLVDPETRKLLPPKLLTEVIDNLPTEIQSKQGGGLPMVSVARFVQLVAPPSQATGGYALVKLIDRKEEVARGKAQRLKARESRKANEAKEIQFAWGIGPADIQHKLRKARQELSRGVRVQLLFARKATGGAQRDIGTKAKQNALVTQVLEALGDVAREWRMRDERRDTVVVYLQDPQRHIPHKSILAKHAQMQTASPNPAQPEKQ
jgi:translation initiation factor IF-3